MHRTNVALLLLLAGTLSGCTRGPSQAGQTELLPVPVAQPVRREVTDFVDYTGRTNAVNPVAIQARVTGFLEEPLFKEGDIVRKDQILFKIDPRQYDGLYQASQSQFAAAQNQLLANQAKLRFDIATNKRFQELAKVNKEAVAALELDKYQALEDQSKANVKLAEANLKLAEANLVQPKLNLDWTDVRSPIDGQVSRYFLTKGNLVEANSTQLTTVMSVDPMYVYFDMDEPTLLRIKQAIHLGSIRTIEGKAPVYIGLQGEEGFQDPDTGKPRHSGTVNFIDNQVNAGTDSIQVRGVFANPELDAEPVAAGLLGSLGAQQALGPLAAVMPFYPRKGGTRMLVPGMFVRVRFPIGEPTMQLLVRDSSIISEQGQKKLFVVNSDSKVQERIVTLGPLLDNGLRVVTGEKLTRDDWIAITSLQQLRPGMEVAREERTMPELGVPSVLIADKDKKTPTKTKAKKK